MTDLIIAQDSSNDNNNPGETENATATVANESRFKIQVNKELSLSAKLTGKNKDLTGKEKLNHLVKTKNKTQYWKTVEVTVDELKAILDAGHTIRGAIKEGGNKKENVKCVSTLWLDFDEGQSIEETKKNPFTKDAFIIYPSPSFTEENQKHRLGFRLSRYPNVEEAELIYLALLDFYKQGDKSTKDAGRLFFGTALEAEILSYDAVLSVDNLIKYAKGLKEQSKQLSLQYSVNTINSKPSVPVTEKSFSQADVVDFNSPEDKEKHPGQFNFFRRVDEFVFNEILVKKCQGKINEFCCFYDHNFVEWVKENDKILNWRGSNFGGNGTGLWVYLQPGENALPCFNSSRDGKGHNWVWYAKEGGKFTGELPLSTTMKGKDFDTIAGLFFTKHGFEYNREDFTVKRSDEEKAELKRKLYYECLETYTRVAPNYIKMCSWDKTAKTFLYYDICDGKWDITDRVSQIFRCTIIPLLDELVITPFNNEYQLNYTARYFLTRCQVKGVPVQLSTEIEDSLKFDNIYPRVSNLIDLLKSRNDKIIPLANGDFNNETGVFKPNFDPGINNQNRFHFEYKSDYSKDGIEALDNWLNAMYDHQDIRDLIKSWLILNMYPLKKMG